MKKAIAWQIDNTNTPKPLEPAAIDLEKRLEDWIEQDPSIVADDTLIIGRQIVTPFGTKLDLLGIDAVGDLVIIELKRDQTLRETVAQSIEYAAWASKLGYTDVLQYGTQKYGDEDSFRQAFEERFGSSLPETVNAGQRIQLVAPAISEVTASVIAYLSETYGVPINGFSFDVFSLDGRQILVRHVVREDDQAPAPAGRKHQPPRTREQFIALAYENGVGEAFEHLLTLEDLLPATKFFVKGMRFSAKTPDNKPLTVLSAFPTVETAKYRIEVYVPPQNLARIYSVPQATCEAFAKELQVIGKAVADWGGWPGLSLTTLEQSEAVVRRFREFITSAPEASSKEATLA